MNCRSNFFCKHTEEKLSAEISVTELGKKYKRFPSHWARLSEYISGGRYCNHKEIWVLRNISFHIQPGEAVGIIGQNGAGKSTLLKILSGTTKPSEGSVKISRNIAALLELGLGFHPEFSGRENAIMACQMMGLRGEETRALLPEIEEFSELGDYLDQPLRVYSTGMQMRLAFSTATAIEPEVLIVDEALAVGDAYFQHKCMQRIRLFKQKGVTLLFVSHDPGAVKSLCERTILLDRGKLIKDGASDVVLDYYNAVIAKKNQDQEIRQVETDFGTTVTRSGSGEVNILKVDMLNEKAKSARAFLVGDTAKLSCQIRFNSPVDNPTIGFIIRDRLGNDVFGTNTFYLNNRHDQYEVNEIIEVIFSVVLNVGIGDYSLCIAVHSGFDHIEANYDWWDQCLVFKVLPSRKARFIGSAALPVDVKIMRNPLIR